MNKLFLLLCLPLSALAFNDPVVPLDESPFAAAFIAGINKGEIERVEISTNPNCMRGRTWVKSKTDPECLPIIRGYLFKTLTKPKAKLLAVHGMQSNAAWFLSGPYLASQGIEVLAFDRRGAGISDGPRGHIETTNELYNDMDVATEYLRNMDLSVPMHLHANCFGTRIAVPYMMEYMEKATRKRLQSEYLAQNPQASQDELDLIDGYQFVSFINTSPATHMSAISEKLYRDNEKCLAQFVVKDKQWILRKSCTERDPLDIDVVGNGLVALQSNELSCLREFANQTVAKDEDLQSQLECNPDYLTELQGNAPGEDALICLENMIYENQDWVAQDVCSAEAHAALKADTKDPSGVAMVKSPLTDDLFTENQKYLELMAKDNTALRAITRKFIFSLVEFTNSMENWLTAPTFFGEQLPLKMQTPVMVVLPIHDRMVENSGIVKDYFSAHIGNSVTEKTDILTDCNRCNPAVMGPQYDPTSCNPASLLSCDNPRQLVQCKTDSSFENCTEFEMKPKEAKRRTLSDKLLFEMDCEHFTEFCSKPAETERYRQAMTEWLLRDRWQLDWQDFFE